MAAHSSVLAWRIPGMGSHRVGHDWSDLAAAVVDFLRASQVALVVNTPPANAGDIETQVQPLGQKLPVEKGMATHSSILAWRILWTEEPKWKWTSCSTFCDPTDRSARLLCPWGFSREEYRSRLPFPSPEDLPDPRIKPWFPTLQVDFSSSESSGK